MADQKISQLTEVTSPSDTDVLPVVNASTTKKLQLANIPVSTATQTALDGKQDSLVSGTNIKTINSTTLLGSGDISLAPSSGINATAISDGSVDNTEFGYLNGVTSAIQTQVDAKLAKYDGTTYDINSLAAVTQAEYDALTPSATTIYFII